MYVPIVIWRSSPLPWIQYKSLDRPRVLFVRSASVAMFRITIAFMPTASSTLIFRLFVASSFSPAVASLVFRLGTAPVSLIESSAEMTYLQFPDVRQCLVSAAKFHKFFVAF